MNNMFEVFLESILWTIGGFLVFKVGGWILLIAVWCILAANNIMMFRRYRDHACKPKTVE